MTIIAAADGSALGNPGPAGWAWYVDDDCWRAGGWKHGTNNMGELKAVLDLLESTADRAGEQLRILCDSQYVINSVTKWMPGWKKKGWKKKDGKPVLNLELLQGIDAALKGRDVEFEWVKGHAGHELNEAADDRARAAATAYQRGKAPEEGPGFAGSDADGAASGGVTALAPSGEPGGGASAAPDGAPQAETDPDGLLPELGEGISLSDPVQISLTLEAEVLEAAESGDEQTLAFLLSPGFRAIGVGGELWDAERYGAVEQGRARVEGIERLAEQTVAPELVQLAFRVLRPGSAELVTSWWRREDGRWRCWFRQETAA